MNGSFISLKSFILVKKGDFGMNNKAQLTIFIIIGILVLLIVGVLVYFVYSPTEEISVPADIKPVYTAVVNCVNSLAKDAISKQAL